MMKTSYDERCFDLAEHFLQDATVTGDMAGRCSVEDAKDSLARKIQKAIEDWFLENTEDDTPQPPEGEAKR